MSELPTSEELAEIKALGAATLFHGAGERGALDPGIKPIVPGTRLAGRALTVDLPPGDNLALHLALAKAGPGDVLMVDAKGELGVAAAGDLVAASCKRSGLAGLVVDGAVRDAEGIAKIGFPVFARGLAIRGPAKDAPGTVGEPVTVGGVTVRTGDVVVGDSDGVVVLDRAGWPEALHKSRQREAREQEMVERIAAGETTVELLGLRDALERHGMT